MNSIESIIKLKDMNHICIEIDNNEFGIKWCEKKMCVDILDFEKRQNHEKNFAKILERNGHVCIKKTRSYPIKILWCEKKICINKKLIE